MSRRSDGVKDATLSLRTRGAGLPMRWMCGGCGGISELLGSRGAGVFKRCARCVAKRAGRE